MFAIEFAKTVMNPLLGLNVKTAEKKHPLTTSAQIAEKT